jgi:hypothetical protein
MLSPQESRFCRLPLNRKVDASLNQSSSKEMTMKRALLAICLIIAASFSVQAQRGDGTPGPALPQDTKCEGLEAMTGKSGWRLISGPSVTAPMTPVNVTPHSAWAAPWGGTSWISVNAGRGAGTSPGDYTYEYVFCVCRKGPALTLNFAADNGAKIYLNGTQIHATTGSNNFSHPQPVSYNGPAFVQYTNSLRIVVNNEGGPTGLIANVVITGAKPSRCQK